MRRLIIPSYVAVFLFALVDHVYAADQSFVDQFIGNPLLILVVMIIIDAIAFAYHRLRK